MGVGFDHQRPTPRLKGLGIVAPAVASPEMFSLMNSRFGEVAGASVVPYRINSAPQWKRRAPLMSVELVPSHLQPISDRVLRNICDPSTQWCFAGKYRDFSILHSFEQGRGIEETSASSAAGSTPRSYPTVGGTQEIRIPGVARRRLKRRPV
jgi:hypothetical protein